MNATTRITPAPATTTPATATPTTGEVDNRSAYLSFTLAYLLGHGGAALSKGADPLLSLPGWLPITLLGAGIVTGVIQSMSASIRAQRGAGKSEALAGQLAGFSWVTGFVALFLAITGLTTAYDTPELQSVLWAAGSVLVVGLIYLAEGAVHRNMLHYGLGTWLALIAAASLFLDAPGLYAVLAIAGGGGYAVAAVLERRRLAL